MPTSVVRTMASVLLGSAGLAVLAFSVASSFRALSVKAIEDGTGGDLITLTFISAPIGVAFIGLAIWLAISTFRGEQKPLGASCKSAPLSMNKGMMAVSRIMRILAWLTAAFVGPFSIAMAIASYRMAHSPRLIAAGTSRDLWILCGISAPIGTMITGCSILMVIQFFRGKYPEFAKAPQD